MKYFTFLLFCILCNLHIAAQDIRLTDFLISPRLDSTYWEKDLEALEANYSSKANKFQTCTFFQTDSTRGRFCFNTTKGHVQLDTTLHNLTSEKVTGVWHLKKLGTFEVTDSMPSVEQTYFRQLSILKENEKPIGTITFTKDKIKFNFENIEEYSDQKYSYYILEGKYLVTKKIAVKSASTIIGLTNEGFLTLDDHTFTTLAKKGQYLIVKTRIRRMILKKE
jgi:hypothetical protein